MKYPQTITFEGRKIRLEGQFKTGTLKTKGGDKRRSKGDAPPAPKPKYRVYGTDVVGKFRVSLPKTVLQ